MKLSINSILTLTFVGLFSCKAQTVRDDQIVSYFEKYSSEYNPKSFALKLTDLSKPIMDKVDMKNTSLITKLKPSVEIILLKQILYDYKTTNLSYDYYHTGNVYPNKLLFIFCLNNGIDTNDILNRKFGEFGFFSPLVFETIKKNKTSSNDTIQGLLNQISKELARFKDD